MDKQPLKAIVSLVFIIGAFVTIFWNVAVAFQFRSDAVRQHAELRNGARQELLTNVEWIKRSLERIENHIKKN